MLTRAGRLVARHLPWWGVSLLGAACVALGGVLAADPSLSLSALDWLAGGALILSGVSELAWSGTGSRPRRSRAVGAVWIVSNCT